MKTSKLFISLFVGLFLFFGCEDLMNNESITLDEDLQALSEGINADIGLFLPDFRAGEKIFQLIC